MSNFSDKHYRDKSDGEYSQRNNIDLFECETIIKLINLKELICLVSGQKGRIICLAEVDLVENQSIFRVEDSSLVADIEENKF